jgi:hypothetical protein
MSYICILFMPMRFWGFFILSLSFLGFSDSYSQDVPIGNWKDYLSYQQGLTVCQGGSTIYCCCSSGVFTYNTQDNSLERFNKITGLSDINATVARYNSYDNVLVIGYSDGNIDLMVNGQIINISDLFNSSVQGSKTINNIYFSKNLAYVCCGQGIIVIDLSQDIILNTYYIGPNATALNIYALTIFNDTIFAATAKGIYYDSVHDPFINDFQDWKVVGSPLPKEYEGTSVFNGIVSCGSKVYASYSRRLTYSSCNTCTTWLEDTIFVYSNGKWSYDSNTLNNNFYSLESCTAKSQTYLVYTTQWGISVRDNAGNQENNVGTYRFGNAASNDAILDNNNNLWIADNNYGLVMCNQNYSGTSYVPSGPFSNKAFAIANANGTIWIAPGGYSFSVPENISGIGISEFSNNIWHRLIVTPTDTLNDLCCFAIDPANPLHAYAGSFSKGVVEYNNNEVVNIYNTSNSTLQGVDGTNQIRCGGVAFDSNGNLWATSYYTNTDYLSVKESNGTWQSFDFSGIITSNGSAVLQVLVTQSQAKWMVFPGTGILVYQDQGTFAQPNFNNSILINAQTGQGHLPSLNIYCITQDQNGAIWVGTDAQVVVFYSPDNVLDGAHDWDAQDVYVTQTGFTQYLMQNQFTTAIAIDGANRKWIGTLGGGAFLMSSDGTQQIANYTTSNSPILSNNIIGITINQQTGEVFFATDKGVVSFQGTSTEGNSVFTNVYAYPDPVPHGYSGPIAIKGLVANSDIKITTVNGELVYHTTALGGQAVWNGLNFDGIRVQTGVYMVFCASPDGTQTFVTKLLFIN